MDNLLDIFVSEHYCFYRCINCAMHSMKTREVLLILLPGPINNRAVPVYS